MLKQIHGTSTAVCLALPTCRVPCAVCRVSGWAGEWFPHDIKGERGLLAPVQKAEAAENIQ